MPALRVLIVDDHDMVRRGLSVFLKSFEDLELVGEARNGEEAIDMVKETRPDVVIMDIMMPEMDGTAATRYIHQHFPKVRVIALSSFSEDTLIQEVLRAGASAHLMKNTSIGELVSAIRYAGTNAALA